MTIDPNNHKILLTSIPRDYYVQLHGTTGLKDKLTHAGIYGIDMSKETLEDVFNINIDYTVKVGFNSVIQIVDLIGGIDIESDLDFTTSGRDGGAVRTHIVKGMNHLNGAQALSYVRERYAYLEGDNHRVQNQQQVLEAIITSSVKNKNIIKQYKEFLESFKNLYRTDIPDSLIKLYIKNQLEDNKPWTIEKQVVKGTGDTNITYSMPGRYLYVMNPDKESIEKATKSINNLINS
jgi:LCP family protein required for cell wall assembly